MDCVCPLSLLLRCFAVIVHRLHSRNAHHIPSLNVQREFPASPMDAAEVTYLSQSKFNANLRETEGNRGGSRCGGPGRETLGSLGPPELKRSGIVTYECPICGHSFAVTDLQQPGGVGGGSYCPNCQERVYVSFAYGGWIAVISFFLALAALALLHVRTILGFVIGAIFIWVPLSLFLNVASSRYRPPTLRKWKQRRRTFFEWLYDRDSVPELIDKRGK